MLILKQVYVNLMLIAKYKWHLSNLVAFIRLNMFVNINLQYWLDKPFEENIELPSQNYIQGVLF